MIQFLLSLPWLYKILLINIFAILLVGTLDYFLFAHGKVPIVWRFGVDHKRPYPCPCSDPNYADKFKLKDQLIVITGGTEGIGKATALQLVKTGADIIIAGRSEEKGLQAIDDIKSQIPDSQIYYKYLDLASFKSIRNFANEVLAGKYGNHEARTIPIYALINNAGVMLVPKKIMTEDGLELTSAVNYFGPFLLIQLLLPALTASGRTSKSPSRIINVSSRAHVIGPTNVTDLGTAFDRNMAYGNSKLAVVMATAELARRCHDNDLKGGAHSPDGCSVIAISLHPGTVDTDLFKNVPAPARWIVRNFFSIDTNRGARTTVFCALSPQIVAGMSGFYFSECQLTPYSPKAADKAKARRLWEDSMKICGLEA